MFRIVAQDKYNITGEYEVKAAEFYDIIKDGTLSSISPKGSSTAHIPQSQLGMQLQQKDNIPFLAIRVADLLKVVKDRGKLPITMVL